MCPSFVVIYTPVSRHKGVRTCIRASPASFSGNISGTVLHSYTSSSLRGLYLCLSTAARMSWEMGVTMFCPRTLRASCQPLRKVLTHVLLPFSSALAAPAKLGFLGSLTQAWPPSLLRSPTSSLTCSPFTLWSRLALPPPAGRHFMFVGVGQGPVELS